MNFSDLSSSILTLETPYLLADKPPKPDTRLPSQNSTSQKSKPYSVQHDSRWHSGAQSSRGSFTDSSEWSGTTRNSSKSAMMDTVKKRPTIRQDEGTVAGNVRASLAFGEEPMSCAGKFYMGKWEICYLSRSLQGLKYFHSQQDSNSYGNPFVEKELQLGNPG